MLNRRTLLQMGGMAGLAALGSAAMPGGDGDATKRPNILWLSVEDISAHLGCYGDPHACTPTIDQLASQGMIFTNAFVTAPVCAPNRSSVISGVYAATLGSLHMRSSGDRATMPAAPPALQLLPEVLRSEGYYCTNNSKEDYNFTLNKAIWDDSSNKAHWRNRPESSQPFFAVFNYTGTHESRIRASKERFAGATAALTDAQRQDPGQVAVPPYHADTSVTRRNWANYHELITGLDYWVAEMLAQLEDDQLADNTIVLFWSDHGVGLPRGKRWLYDSGVHVPLIVYAPEKWCDYAGITPGARDDRLVSCLDLAPTTLALAGAPIPDTMQGRSFLGPNQGPPRECVFATRDRMDERYDTIRMVRDKRYKYIRNYQPFRPYNQYLSYNEQSPVQQDLNRLAAKGALPAGAHWMAAERKPVEELYDTESDPHEISNLADRPESAPILHHMRKALDAQMEAIDDLGLLPEAELDRLGRLYEFRYHIRKRHEAAHPGFWQQLHDTACIAGRPERSDAPALLRALESAHPAIRWWAVTGLTQLTSVSEPARDALRRALTDDAMLVVTAAAYGILQHEDAHNVARDTLAKALHDADPWIRLQAAIALNDVGEKARSAVPDLKQALDDPDNQYVVRVARRALDLLLGTNKEAS